MDGFNERQYPAHEKGDSAECLWCGEWVTDGSEESGYTGDGPDWMDDGDFGCSDSPLNTDEGTGGHQTREDVARAIWELNERQWAEHDVKDTEREERFARIDPQVAKESRERMTRYGYTA